MTPEIQRSLQFIGEQQAQFEVNLQRNQEQLHLYARQSREVDALIESQVRALSDELRTLSAEVRETAQAVRELQIACRDLLDHARNSDQRLDRLERS